MKIKDILKNARLSISPKKLKVLLKPSRKKILVSFILFVVSLLPLVLLYNISYFDFGAMPMAAVFGSILVILFSLYLILFSVPSIVFGGTSAFPITMLILGLIAYFFGSWIVEKKSWIKGLAFYIVSLWIAAAIMMAAIDAYNDAFGYSCQTDEDCIFTSCLTGIVGKPYIRMTDPFLVYHCSSKDIYSICENSRCTGINVSSPLSESDCEKVKDIHLQSECYYNLAKKSLNEKTCEKIKEEGLKQSCYGLIQNEDV